MTLFVLFERGGPIGVLWHATGTNEDAAGARSGNSMTNSMIQVFIMTGHGKIPLVVQFRPD